MFLNYDLAGNKMYEKSGKGLSRGKWPALNRINISNIFSTKAITSWGKRGWPTFPRWSGGRLKKLI